MENKDENPMLWKEDQYVAGNIILIYYDFITYIRIILNLTFFCNTCVFETIFI